MRTEKPKSELIASSKWIDMDSTALAVTLSIFRGIIDFRLISFRLRLQIDSIKCNFSSKNAHFQQVIIGNVRIESLIPVNSKTFS